MLGGQTTVVIVNYFSEVELEKCLASIPCDEIGGCVVVDNGSNPEALLEIQVRHSSIVILASGGNVGFGRACNMGMQWALRNTECEFVMLLNPDTTVRAGAVRLLESALHRDFGVGAAVPKIVFMDDPESLWYGGGDMYWPKASVRVPGYGGNASAPEVMFARNVTFASGCAVLLRREAIERVGGFDDRYFMYEEDVELSLRIIEAGYRIKYVPESVILHKTQGTQRREGEKPLDMYDPRNPRLPFYMYHVTKGRLMTLGRHARGVDRLVALVIFPVYWGLLCTKLLLRGRIDAVRAALSGVRDYLKCPRPSV